MRSLAKLLLVALAVGCGGVTGANNGDEDVDPNAQPNLDPNNLSTSVKDKVGDEVVDRLDCSGFVREETRTLITDALQAADFAPENLATSPQEIGRLVGSVVASTDATSLLVGNVVQIGRTGHMPMALGGQWDQLTCGETTEFSCTDAISAEETGTGTSTVECDGEEVSAVRTSFSDGCRLFVTQNDGAVSLRRSDNVFVFDEFALGSVRQVDGELSLGFADEEVNRIEVAPDAEISVASNAGKSCEERLTIRELLAESEPGVASLTLDAERLSDGKTLGITTVEPAAYSADRNCACPDPGAVIDWRWAGFLDGEGVADLRFSYGEPNNDDTCASVDVEILSWPEQCDGESADCGREAIQTILGPIVSAGCVARELPNIDGGG